MSKLDNSLAIVDEVLNNRKNEWKLQSFPMILKSCYMSENAYDNLTNRFLKKILISEKLVYQKFIISFTGSSVTDSS